MTTTSPQTDSAAAAEPVIVAMWLGRRPLSLLPTLASLPKGTIVVCGAPDGVSVPPELGVDPVRAPSVSRFVRTLAVRQRGPLLLVGEPVVFPPDPFSRAYALLDDRRVATVSFLSNCSIWPQYHGALGPAHWAAFGLDQRSITQRLRARTSDVDAAALLFAHGGAVLLGQSALELVDDAAETASGSFPGYLADLSLRARRRGLLDLLDATTYVMQPTDLTAPGDGLISDADRDELLARHPFALHTLRLNPEPHAPVTLALQVARTKTTGLRIVIDGSRLGPFETGTQVGIVELVDAFQKRDDVESVSVTLAGPWPAYARRLMDHPKVRTIRPGEVPDPQADVFFRPFQPDASFSITHARTVARRVVVNVLDLIAYQVGAYFPSAETWWEYRAVTRSATLAADGVATISRDVVDLMRLERIDVDPSRLFPVPFGADHLTGDEPGEPPHELVAAGLTARPFLLSLGTNYSHKNRDIAVRAHAEMRRRGHDHVLVLAGPAVPHGSSRIAEARALLAGDDDVITLPDVSTFGRNWLLRHASAVLYPTSAEGFGFVPYEAAVFGTPTVFVPFGPITEISGTTVGTAADWSPDTPESGAAR